MSDIKVDRVIAKYLELRGSLEQLTNEYNTAKKGINEQLSKLEAWLLEKMNAEGLESFKTAEGTAYQVKTDSTSVADWNSFIEHVIETQSWQLLEKRVSKQAVRELLDDGQGIPPGVNYFTRIDVNIRKPTK